MTSWPSRLVAVSVMIALILVLLLGQAAGDGIASEARGEDTGAAVGEASFAYLTGLRVFAGALLWNRIEPLLHGYYADVPLSQQAHIVPTIRMVVLLDPQFEQAYYVGSWIVFRRDDPEIGIELAKDGVESNPDSGLLLSSVAQLLLVDGRAREAVVYAERAVDADYPDDVARWEALAIVRSVHDSAGDPERADEIRRVMAELDERIHESGTVHEHDHEHDHDE